MGRIMRRLESGARWWAAEIVLRTFGLALFGLCALSAHWLYRSVHLATFSAPGLRDYGAALAAYLCWWLGGAFLCYGPGLFRLIDLPPRYRRFGR